MYIMENAWKNIGRNKGRNILISAIILLIIAASAVALIIGNTSGKIIDHYKQRFDSEVSLTPNFEKIKPVQVQGPNGAMMSRMQMPELSAEQYLDFGDSEGGYLSAAHYASWVGVFAGEDIKPIDEDKGGGGRGMMRVSSVSDGSYEPLEDTGFYAKLMGYNFVPDEFEKEGTRQLADGKFPENDGECIISRDLLESSGLEIGATINLTSSLTDTELPLPGEEDSAQTAEISYRLEIVGYYDDITDAYANDFMQNAYENRRNEIITTINTVIEQMREGFSGIRVSAKYYLKNPGDLEAFAAELRAKGLGDEWNVDTDENSYNTIVKPVEGLKSVTLVFLAVVLLLGAIILILLSTIAVRERKYEIGVLRAMGMKKSKVAFGLLSEIMMITLACLVTGMAAGILTAQGVSDMLLENQIMQIEEPEGGNTVFGPGGPVRIGQGGNVAMGARIGGDMGAPAEALREMDVNMDLATGAEIALVSLFLAVAASVAGILHVTRYEPIRILSDRA